MRGIGTPVSFAACPLWVRSRHRPARNPCPLYLQSRKSDGDNRYPYEVAMFRLEDTMTLKFAINRQGDILYYHLIKKSEYHLVNKAIEWMMDRSSLVSPIPPEIAKNELTFTVPVHFDPHLLS
ncbi:MAG: TonB family protein [Alphaproteobacteria bacterium]